jgi:putative membrane protein
VAVLHAANLGEIQEAMLAETRAVTASVRGFATMMNTEHSAADRDLMNLAADAGAALTPTESAISIQLTATAMMKLQALQPLMGITFDRQYMNDQVEMHTQVLTLINDLLLPSAMNAALRMQITMMQSAVTMHLTQARTILDGLDTDAGDAGGSADASADGAMDARADAEAGDGRSDAPDGG